MKKIMNKEVKIGTIIGWGILIAVILGFEWFGLNRIMGDHKKGTVIYNNETYNSSKMQWCECTIVEQTATDKGYIVVVETSRNNRYSFLSKEKIEEEKILCFFDEEELLFSVYNITTNA